jgi:hypothetical protein
MPCDRPDLSFMPYPASARSAGCRFPDPCTLTSDGRSIRARAAGMCYDKSWGLHRTPLALVRIVRAVASCFPGRVPLSIRNARLSRAIPQGDAQHLSLHGGTLRDQTGCAEIIPNITLSTAAQRLNARRGSPQLCPRGGQLRVRTQPSAGSIWSRSHCLGIGGTFPRYFPVSTPSRSCADRRSRKRSDQRRLKTSIAVLPRIFWAFSTFVASNTA